MSTEAITQSIIASQTAEPAAAESVESIMPESTEVNVAGDSDLAQRLAILAKKEKGLLTKQQSFAQKMKEIEEKDWMGEVVSVICGKEFYNKYDSEDLEYVKEVMRECCRVNVEFNLENEEVYLVSFVDEDEGRIS